LFLFLFCFPVSPVFFRGDIGRIGIVRRYMSDLLITKFPRNQITKHEEAKENREKRKKLVMKQLRAEPSLDEPRITHSQSGTGPRWRRHSEFSLEEIQVETAPDPITSPGFIPSFTIFGNTQGPS
jgi:hypothetical protein